MNVTTTSEQNSLQVQGLSHPNSISYQRPFQIFTQTQIISSLNTCPTNHASEN